MNATTLYRHLQAEAAIWPWAQRILVEVDVRLERGDELPIIFNEQEIWIVRMGWVGDRKNVKIAHRIRIPCAPGHNRSGGAGFMACKCGTEVVFKGASLYATEPGRSRRDLHTILCVDKVCKRCDLRDVEKRMAFNRFPRAPGHQRSASARSAAKVLRALERRTPPGRVEATFASQEDAALVLARLPEGARIDLVVPTDLPRPRNFVQVHPLEPAPLGED